MPTINIPPKVRFVLYLIAAIGSAVVVYAMDKNWAGEAEFKLWTALAGLLSLLAASKTSTSDTVPMSEAEIFASPTSFRGDHVGEFEAVVEDHQ